MQEGALVLPHLCMGPNDIHLRISVFHERQGQSFVLGTNRRPGGLVGS